MKTLASVDLARPYVFTSPFGTGEYVAWIVSQDPSVTIPEMVTLAGALIDTGCRYAVCSGFHCAQWDSAIDLAYIHMCPDVEPQEANFVMSSSHPTDDIQDTADFVVNRTAFDEFVPQHFVVIAVGAGPQAKWALAYAQAHLCSIKDLTENVST